MGVKVGLEQLKQLTLGAVTTSSGRLFQSPTSLSEKKDNLSLVLAKAPKSFLLLPRVSEYVAIVNWGFLTR